jgi:hypothetical protein
VTTRRAVDEPIDSILSHLALCLGQCLEGKLLAVRACDGVVDQGILAGVLGLCLLELLHQVGSVGGAFLVGRVQATGDDLLDHVEAHWGRWLACAWSRGWRAGLTPVGDDGLDALELGGAFRRLGELQLLELCGSDAGHGFANAVVVSGGGRGLGSASITVLVPRLGSPLKDAVIGASSSTPVSPHRSSGQVDTDEAVTNEEKRPTWHQAQVNIYKPASGSSLFFLLILTTTPSTTMVRTSTLFAATAALALNARAESMYSKNSAVVQITGMDYDRVIAKSNYTSVSILREVVQMPANNMLDCRVSCPVLIKRRILTPPDSTRHGVAIARTSSPLTRRPPNLSKASPRSLPSTVTKR